MTPITILIADDDAGMRLVMRRLVERAEGYELAGEAAAGDDEEKTVTRTTKRGSKAKSTEKKSSKTKSTQKSKKTKIKERKPKTTTQTVNTGVRSVRNRKK